MNEGNQAANPGGTPAPGQAATPAPQGAPQPGQQPAQGGQAATPPQGQQGEPTGSAAQPAPPATPGQPPPSGAPAAAPPTVPERYELHLPDQSPLDQTDLDAIAALAKAKGWTNEQAQVALQETSTALVEQHTAFRSELDADPEVGGAHLEAAQLLARRVMDRFLPEREVHGQRLRSAMNKSGYGNFTPLVVLLARIGQAMSEDQPGAGASGRVFSGQPRSQADRLFGDAQGIRPPT